MFSQDLANLFRHLSRLHGIAITWKDADAQMRKIMPLDISTHQAPRCLREKEKEQARSFGNRCAQHCSATVFKWGYRDAVKQESTCHAACTVYRFPIYHNDELIGSVVLGPYRLGSTPDDLPIAPQKRQELQDFLTSLLEQYAEKRTIEREALFSALPILQQNVDNFSMETLRKIFLNKNAHMPLCYGYKLQDLAEAGGLSLAQTQRLSQEYWGESLGRVYTQALLQAVQEKLYSFQGSMRDFAISFGFEDQRYFSTWFKRELGLTPSQWRQQQQDRDFEEI